MNYDNCLITGGTGTFGTSYIMLAIEKRWHKKIIVYSRDEYKQIKMYQFLKTFFADSLIGKELPPYSITINETQIRFFIGDVCDYERLCTATRKVDLVIHAAALKHVPICEYNPMQATKINIGGTTNVVNASGTNGVKKVIALSTDKAVDPINIYGATKLCLEKVILGGNNYYPDMSMMVVRYGNIIGSRGSIIHNLLTFKEEEIDLTDPDMTRFWLTIEEAVELVQKAVGMSGSSVVCVPKLKALRLSDLFKMVRPDLKVNIIGARPGEKIHEKMLTENDLPSTFEHKELDCFVIDASPRTSDNRAPSLVAPLESAKFRQYTSDVVERFRKDEFLLKLKGSIINKIYGMEKIL